MRRALFAAWIGCLMIGALNLAAAMTSGADFPDVSQLSARPELPDPKACDADRGTQIDVWAIEDSIDRGYAATFDSGDIAPDHPGFTDGVIPRYLKPGQTKPGPHDWGTVAAWVWGLSRAVDYLRTEPQIDRSRIVVVGHSRLGKAALVAGAFDERIALVIPHQAGCSGSAPEPGEGRRVGQADQHQLPPLVRRRIQEFQ
jgi:hypothetical protein